jgi:hypothetical protein
VSPYGISGVAVSSRRGGGKFIKWGVDTSLARPVDMVVDQRSEAFSCRSW